MKLLLILAADCANVTDNGKLNVMGIFNQIYAPSFPIRHSSMHLVVKLGAELGEYGETRTLSVQLREPDGKLLFNLSRPVNIPKGDSGIKPEVNAIYELKDIVFPKPGPYQIVVLVDKDYKGDLTLYVNQIQVPPTGDQPKDVDGL